MGKYDTLFSLNMKVQDIGGKILSLKRIPYVIKEKKTLSKNKELVTNRKSDTVYILGLGPSLKEIDLTKLEGDTIAINRYYRYDSRKEFEPTYYLLMDNDFFCEKEIGCLINAKKQYPKSIFVLNGRYHSVAEKAIGSDFVYYLFSWKGLFSGSRIDLCKVLPAFGNSVCCAIGLAIGVGYKKIILLGCDFNSFATQKVEHCYSESKDVPKLRPLSVELFDYSFVAEMHNRLASFASLNGVYIFNGTPNSLIDSYPFLPKGEQSEIGK